MGVNSDSSDKTLLSDDWNTISFELPSAVPQNENDSTSDNTENPLDVRPARYPQWVLRPVKRFELIEFCI